MKALMTTFVPLVLALTGAMAQNSSTYIFYSKEAQHFKVLLSGITQNAVPMDRVTVVGVSGEAFSLQTKFIFEDERLGEFKQQLSFEPGRVVVFELTSTPEPTCRKVRSVANKDYSDALLNVVQYRNAEIDAPVDEKPIQTTKVFKVVNGEVVADSESEAPVSVGEVEQDPGIADYDGPNGCEFPMGDKLAEEFRLALLPMKDDPAKLALLRSSLSGKCFRVDQCDEILATFTSENMRIEAAKSLFAVTWDRANVMLLRSSFTSTDTWNAYLNFINTYQDR